MIYLPQALIKRHQSTKGKLNEVMMRDKTLNGSQMVSVVKIFKVITIVKRTSWLLLSKFLIYFFKNNKLRE